MRFIKTNDDNIILYTSKGLHNIPKSHYNYLRINRIFDNMLKEGNMDEEKILDLLKVPDLSNGVYKAYLINYEIVLLFVKDVQEPKVLSIDGKHKGITGVNQIEYHKHGVLKTEPSKFKLDGFKEKIDELLGYYQDINQIVREWPEYV